MQTSGDYMCYVKSFRLRARGSYLLLHTRRFRQYARWFRNARANRILFLISTAFVGILISAGCTKKVVVPDVAKQNLDQAGKILAAVPLKTGNISGAMGPGAYVVRQDPLAGQQVAANSNVNLVVELPVSVPLLTGKNISDAVVMLQGLELKVAFVSQSTINPFGKAKVEQQDPAPNSLVHRGAVVTLSVSRPPDIGALVGLVAKESAYQNLKPEYRNFLDQFLGNPTVSRSMEAESTPGTPSVPNAPSTPVK